MAVLVAAANVTLAASDDVDPRTFDAWAGADGRQRGDQRLHHRGRLPREDSLARRRTIAARGRQPARSDAGARDRQGNTISNDNRRATQEAEIIATTVPPTNDREAAMVATLVPGNYTAVVRGNDDTVGLALLEGYILP